jgi:hypothetical protein
VNQQQRKYLIERVTEEQKNKSRNISTYHNGPYWDVNDERLTVIAAKISSYMTKEFPELGQLTYSINGRQSDSNYRGNFSFNIGPSPEEKCKKRTVTDNVKKLEQIRQEAKKVSDTIMLGEETEALKMLQDFMKMEF